jgi:hypothetical protein
VNVPIISQTSTAALVRRLVVPLLAGLLALLAASLILAY